MQKIQQLWRWYIRGGVPETASIGQLRKLQFINIISLIGFFACIPFGIFDFPRYKIVGSIEFASGVTFLLAGIVQHIWHKPRLATNLIILATFLLALMLAMTGGGDGAGIVWLLVFPPLLFFLEDKKASFIWVGLLLLALAVLFFTGHLYYKYDTFFYQHTSYAIIVISIVVYFYQDVNRQAERTNEKVKLALAESNQKLHQTNSELSDAKAHVEAQVVQRTQSLIKEHARLESSVANLPIGFILTDENLFIASINDTARQLLSRKVASQNEKSYSNIIRDELNLGDAIKDTIANKKRIDIDELNYQKCILHITLSPIIVNNNEQAIGVAVLLEDITEKKIIARAHDEFFLAASHELRTPLTIVEGNISIIKENFLTEINNIELHHMIDNVYDSTKRLMYIVNQLLQVSALEVGDVSLQPHNYNVDELVEATVDKFRSRAKSKQITLSLHSRLKEHTKVYADAERFDQVLGSLIDNAVRNTSEGGVEVSIERSSENARIYIKDTGRGIGKENQALLFHKFHQSDANILTRSEGQSIGLGLYTTRLLVDKMHGKVYLQESEAGKGSIFVFEIPLEKVY